MPRLKYPDVQYTISLDSLDLSFLERYIYKSPREKSLLWSKPKLDGVVDYCTVKVVSDEPDDPLFEPCASHKCYVCNITVPNIYGKEHLSSRKHRAYTIFINQLLRNLSKLFKSTTKYENNNVNTDLYYCEICSKAVRNSNRYKHEMTDDHSQCSDNQKIIEDFVNLYLNGEEIDYQFVSTQFDNDPPKHQLVRFQSNAQSVDQSQTINIQVQSQCGDESVEQCQSENYQITDIESGISHNMNSQSYTERQTVTKKVNLETESCAKTATKELNNNDNKTPDSNGLIFNINNIELTKQLIIDTHIIDQFKMYEDYDFDLYKPSQYTSIRYEKDNKEKTPPAKRSEFEKAITKYKSKSNGKDTEIANTNFSVKQVSKTSNGGKKVGLKDIKPVGSRNFAINSLTSREETIKMNASKDTAIDTNVSKTNDLKNELKNNDLKVIAGKTNGATNSKSTEFKDTAMKTGASRDTSITTIDKNKLKNNDLKVIADTTNGATNSKSTEFKDAAMKTGASKENTGAANTTIDAKDVSNTNAFKNKVTNNNLKDIAGKSGASKSAKSDVIITNASKDTKIDSKEVSTTNAFKNNGTNNDLKDIAAKTVGAKSRVNNSLKNKAEKSTDSKDIVINSGASENTAITTIDLGNVSHANAYKATLTKNDFKDIAGKTVGAKNTGKSEIITTDTLKNKAPMSKTVSLKDAAKKPVDTIDGSTTNAFKNNVTNNDLKDVANKTNGAKSTVKSDIKTDSFKNSTAKSTDSKDIVMKAVTSSETAIKSADTRDISNMNVFKHNENNTGSQDTVKIGATNSTKSDVIKTENFKNKATKMTYSDVTAMKATVSNTAFKDKIMNNDLKTNVVTSTVKSDVTGDSKDTTSTKTSASTLLMNAFKVSEENTFDIKYIAAKTAASNTTKSDVFKTDYFKNKAGMSNIVGTKDNANKKINTIDSSSVGFKNKSTNTDFKDIIGNTIGAKNASKLLDAENIIMKTEASRVVTTGTRDDLMRSICKKDMNKTMKSERNNDGTIKLNPVSENMKIIAEKHNKANMCEVKNSAKQSKIKYDEKTAEYKEYLSDIVSKYKLVYDKPVVKEKEVIIVTPKGFKMQIPELSFHSYRVIGQAVYCQLCNVWTTEEEAHSMCEPHVRMITRNIDDDFLREMNSEWSHCLVCNEKVLPGITHAAFNEHHRKQVAKYNKAQWLTCSANTIQNIHAITKPNSYYCNKCQEFTNLDVKVHKTTVQHQLAILFNSYIKTYFRKKLMKAAKCVKVDDVKGRSDVMTSKDLMSKLEALASKDSTRKRDV
ncbi:uncharacterized protein LOC142985545 [Anticarsia gemmatalis]|uniref:uncharacterized protein LOC142985545 n=1 Tax=Anticarsia gemmatalis TaxID=129554 RepID=UPI003F7645AA